MESQPEVPTAHKETEGYGTDTNEDEQTEHNSPVVLCCPWTIPCLKGSDAFPGGEGHTATAVSNRIFIYGGVNGNHNTYSNVMYVIANTLSICCNLTYDSDIQVLPRYWYVVNHLIHPSTSPKL